MSVSAASSGSGLCDGAGVSASAAGLMFASAVKITWLWRPSAVATPFSSVENTLIRLSKESST